MTSKSIPIPELEKMIVEAERDKKLNIGFGDAISNLKFILKREGYL